MSKGNNITEFDLINDYFSGMTRRRRDVLLGIGDDAALIRVPKGMDLALSVDTLVAGVHFFPEIPPADLGYKVLAVNLSDLAAMGAEPAWVTLALTIPQIDDQWIAGFCSGFTELATRFDLQLVGGDTTAGPLSVTVQVQGLIPAGEGLRRSGAVAGDDIYVTGGLGDAALALRCKQQGTDQREDMEQLSMRLDRPVPRVEAGIALRGIASSAIDISDGLVADLGHILKSSGVGARVTLDNLPMSPAVAAALEESGDWAMVVAGGDDYELCFTVPPERRDQLAEIEKQAGVAITRIGVVEARAGLRCLHGDGSLWQPDRGGFEHFANGSGQY
ncbi:MAG: thiamine-phosphate kinase [Candidatus Thiodiazotropha sp.]